MAKLTRAQLKGIVKECLVEILVEGLDSDSAAEAPGVSSLFESAAPKSKPRRSSVIENRRPAADHVRFESAVKQSVSELTNSSMMADIFSDTARTTLQEQLANEVPGAAPTSDLGSPGPQEQIGDPSEIFAASENWAALAFSEPISKKS